MVPDVSDRTLPELISLEGRTAVVTGAGHGAAAAQSHRHQAVVRGHRGMDALTGPPPGLGTELHAALLQAVITAALAALCAFLYSRYHKPYVRWWAAAWTLYLLPTSS